MRIAKFLTALLVTGATLTSAAAQEPFAGGEFRVVAGLTASNTLREAQDKYGLGFLTGKRATVTFNNTGPDGTTYSMAFTPHVDIRVGCGWFPDSAPHDAVYTLCHAKNEDEVRQLLSKGQDRNSFLFLIGGKLKGVQYDYGKSLVTVAFPDPAQPPKSVSVAWCTSAGC